MAESEFEPRTSSLCCTPQRVDISHVSQLVAGELSASCVTLKPEHNMVSPGCPPNYRIGQTHHTTLTHLKPPALTPAALPGPPGSSRVVPPMLISQNRASALAWLPPLLWCLLTQEALCPPFIGEQHPALGPPRPVLFSPKPSSPPAVCTHLLINPHWRSVPRGPAPGLPSRSPPSTRAGI